MAPWETVRCLRKGLRRKGRKGSLWRRKRAAFGKRKDGLVDTGRHQSRL